MKKILLILFLLPLFCISQNTWFNTYPRGDVQVAPTITITSATASYTSIHIGYSTTLGTPTATEAGFCWNTTGNPTVDDFHQPEPTSSGADHIYGLTHNTTYYIRAFIISSMGTYYSNEVSRTTLNGLPVVSTAEMASSIGTTTAECGGEVNSSGGSSVTDMGICWSSSNSNPTISDSHASKYVGNEQGFVTALTGLTPSTLYYFRAYATNSFGSGYGSVFTFTTNSSGCVLATLTTTSISNITDNSAVSGGNVLSDGGCSVTARGVCWSTSQNPTIADSHTSDGTGTGSFSSSITGLTCGTTYYVRAYATNSQGTSYGNEVSFTTIGFAGSVSTLAAQDYETCDFANFYGNIINTGCLTGYSYGPNWKKGFVWNTTQNPTLSSTISDILCGEMNVTGEYTCSVNPPIPNTIYYVRAYIKSPYGTVYGDQVSFTTSCTLATVITTNISNITGSSATGGGNVTSSGSSYVSAKGICWSTSQNPTISNSHTNDGNSVGSFTSSITGLDFCTTYYVRAYATNSVGTIYGDQVSFTTSSNTYSSIALCYQINVSTCGFTGSFWDSLSQTQEACQDFKDVSDGKCTITQYTESVPRVESFEVGKQLYANSCEKITSTHYYIYHPTLSDRAIVYVVNGVIQSITSCP